MRTQWFYCENLHREVQTQAAPQLQTLCSTSVHKKLKSYEYMTYNTMNGSARTHTSMVAETHWLTTTTVRKVQPSKLN